MKPRKASNVFVRLLRFLVPVKKLAMTSAFLLVLGIGLEVASVYLLSPLITTVSSGLRKTSENLGFFEWLVSADPSATNLRNVVLAIMALQVVRGLVSYTRALRDMKLSQHLAEHIRALMYDRLQHLAFSFVDKMTNGKLISRALKDIDAIHGFLNGGFILILDIVVSITAYLALLGFRSPYLVLTAVALLPIWTWLVFKLSQSGRHLYRAQHEAWDSMMTAVTENVAGKHIVKAFGTEREEADKYLDRTNVFLDRLYSVIRFQARLSPTMRLFAALAHITIFTVCALLIQRGVLPVGDLMILGAAMATILSKLEQIRQLSESYQMAMVSGERVFEILDAETLGTKDAGQMPFPKKQGDIVFKDVVFGYKPSRPVLKGIDLTLKGNSVTALVGPTGAGKSTIASLVGRFYDPDFGKIEIDGRPLKMLDLQDLRHHVGYVFQETFLFTDSIMNNIRYGRTDVSDEMAFAAARASFADEFIENLPNGYDTPLGEHGVQLSGGQRQRLALARALVYDPKILILDDATAALDATTEREIQHRLRYVFMGRTVLLITHRLSNLKLADQIVVLEDGRVTQSGTHSELMAQPGHYSDIVREMHESEPSDTIYEQPLVAVP